MNKPIAGSSAGLDHWMLGTHRFALVAAESLDRLPIGCTTHPTACGPLNDSEGLLPRLLDLAGMDASAQEALLISEAMAAECGDMPTVAALLRSDADVVVLSSHLARAQLLESESGEQAWLRMHDPRVWFHLARVFSPAKWASLFGPISSWTFLCNGRWYHQTRPEGASHIRPRLDRSTWSALGRIGAINRVLAREGCTDADLDDLNRISLVIDALIERADSIHGLRRMDDLIEFGHLGMTVHPQFDRHPSVAALLAVSAEEAISNEQTPLDRLLLQEPAFWDRVRMDLRQKT